MPNRGIIDYNEVVLSQFEEYLTQIALSPQTIKNYLADLRRFTRWAEQTCTDDFSLLTITPQHIRTYRDYLLTGEQMATATVNRHLQSIRKCCTYIVQANLAAVNPAEEISLLPESQPSVPPMLTAEQITGFIDAAAATRTSIARRDVAILHLLVNTGLRVAEIIALQIDQVEFDYPGVHLTIIDSRGNGSRNIPLEPQVCRVIKDWLLVRPDVAYHHVFLNQEGTPVSTRTIQRIVQRCAQTAGLSGITPQLLRRTYALSLLSTSHDLSLVSRRLGHQSLKITLQYLNLTQQPSQVA